MSSKKWFRHEVLVAEGLRETPCQLLEEVYERLKDKPEIGWRWSGTGLLNPRSEKGASGCLSARAVRGPAVDLEEATIRIPSFPGEADRVEAWYVGVTTLSISVPRP